MAKKIIEVAFSKLELDQENARFENQVVSNQRDAIQYLLSIDNMADKVAVLAEHIALNGDDPSELPLVIPHPQKEKSFIIVEGNRRLLALKLLRNPALCPPGQKSLQKKLNGILGKLRVPLPNKIYCSLLDNRGLADIWIELKHTGANGGAGRVEWDGSARDAFREKQGATKSVGRTILEYIANDALFNEDLKAFSKSISITNLTRLFGATETMKAVGYSISNGKLILKYSENKFRLALEEIIGRFKEDDIKVGDIYNSSARKHFLEKRLDQRVLPGRSADSDFIEPGAGSIEQGDAVIAPTEDKGFDVQAPTGPSLDEYALPSLPVKTAGIKRSSRPAANLRKNLVNFTLRISQPRINHVYLELKNKTDVTHTPNAVSVLFRVFLELTTDYALKDLGLKPKAGIPKDSVLRVKIEAVLNKLSEREVLDSKSVQDLKTLLTSSGFRNGNVDALHRFIHGVNQPLPTELNDMMDNWKPYFCAVWEYDAHLKSASGQSQPESV